ncbi:MAG: hypothetical protein R2855_06365 [Thermomicrobiales bacterium]
MFANYFDGIAALSMKDTTLDRPIGTHAQLDFARPVAARIVPDHHRCVHLDPAHRLGNLRCGTVQADATRNEHSDATGADDPGHLATGRSPSEYTRESIELITLHIDASPIHFVQTNKISRLLAPPFGADSLTTCRRPR